MVKETEIDDSKVEDSNVKNSDIDDSKVKNSFVEDSNIEDSEIQDSHIEESEIKNSKVIGEEIKDNKRISKEINHKYVDDESLIKERGEKVFSLLKKRWVWTIGFLIIALILGIYIRSMPMQDHDLGTPGLQPGLWDVTTDTWTLGPDLDPWFFTRYAKTIVEQGSIPKMDMMRYPPLGFDTTRETIILPYMIVMTYHFFHFFDSNVNVEFAAVVFPVVMFALTILAFFLFVREIFIKKSEKSKTRANIIALISSFFLIVIPVFLSRTIAGIPEKESASFFFMFLAFYFFLKAWKSESLKNGIVFAILAGIATGLMGLIWGGVVYLFVGIAAATFIAFILGKVKEKETLFYSLWMISSIAVLLIFSNRYTLSSLLKSTDYMAFILVFFILIVNLIVGRTRFSKEEFLKKIKLPRNIFSLILSIFIGLILISIILGPGFIFERVVGVINTFINPTTGRWATTVAENRQPYFQEWGNSFGPFVRDIPIMFWLFFVGSVLLFKNMIKELKKKDSWALLFFYVLFFFGVVFSKYSSSSIFNGDNSISKFVYFGTGILFIGSLIYYYIRYNKENNRSFEKIDFGLILLFSFFMLSLFTARSAIRLIMVLGTIVPVFVGYLIIKSIEKFKETKDETWKIILGALVILILLLSIFTFWTFYQSITAQAYSFIPSHYNQQWQKAMKWVRDETPKDAVFSHWWDYGYWVQSIGNRATVLDGGNMISYWNYLMGRLVLTGDNQQDALEFLYNHNATHLLIDSSDIGKYGAFSSIGSDKDYDRYSWMGTFTLNEKQTQETKNQTLFLYSGGVALDEDLIIEEDGKEILFPKQKSGVGAIMLPVEKGEGEEEFGQPQAVLFYNGRQQKVNLRYLSISGKFFDFKTGIEACAYILPLLNQEGQGISQNPIGVAVFISPRLFRGMLSQVYILDDPLERFSNFKLVHTEPSLIIESLNQQGMNLPDFVYYNGIQGPIKIWEIEYSGEEKIREEYIDTDYKKYLDWIL